MASMAVNGKEAADEKNASEAREESRAWVPVSAAERLVEHHAASEEAAIGATMRSNERLSAATSNISMDKIAQESERFLLVAPSQRRNPLLQFIRQVKWKVMGGFAADYQMGPSSSAYFLSLQYHILYPDYIYRRTALRKKKTSLTVLLCLVDIEDSDSPIKKLSKMCFDSDMTMICCWSNEEAARYLEIFKAYHGKSTASIEKPEEKTYLAQVSRVLTLVRSVNKSDVLTLITTFGSIAGIASASVEELLLCPGLGEKKAKAVHAAFHSSISQSQ